ncbi:MAG: hypothetical protein NVS2B9_05920 [Myxococcales bacterium]
MDLLSLVRARLRGDSAQARRARKLVRGLLAARARPSALHRALLVERSLRRFVLGEAARMLYYQPLFELLCAEVGDGCRLELCPDSKLPVVDNCALVLGDRVRLSARATFQGARNAPARPRIEIGSDTYLGHRVILRAGLGIRLGQHVTIASNVILSGDPGHPLDPLARRSQPAPREDLRHIELGDDVWIAEGATVLGGVRVGAGAVIGAHAVVTRDVPPLCVVGGNPARVLKQIGTAGEASAARVAAGGAPDAEPGAALHAG